MIDETWPTERIRRFAVVATHNRPAELNRCVEALAPQVDGIVVIDNASDPPCSFTWLHSHAWAVGEAFLNLIRDEEQPPNLSRLWNLGLDEVARACVRVGLKQWDVAVVNDDATVPPGWFDALSEAMRANRTVMAASTAPPFADPGPGVNQYWTTQAPMSVVTRLTGWAFILRGEWEGARLDEQFRWWCGDDDISYRARQAGGLVQVGGLHVPNEYADQSTTGALAEQTALDMQAFVDKHGKRPW